MARRLIPGAVGMEQRHGVFRQLIAGEERNMVIGHKGYLVEQQVGALLAAFANHKRQHQVPGRRKGDPHPGIAIGFVIELGTGQMFLFGVHEAPQFIQLTLSDMQVSPKVQHDQATMLSGTVQPVTSRVFVDLDNTACGPEGISLRQSPHPGLENDRVSVQLVVSGAIAYRHTAPTGLAQGLRLAVTGAVLDQNALVERNPMASTLVIRAIERFPIHEVLLDEAESHRGIQPNSKIHQSHQGS